MANIWEHPQIIAAEALRHLEDALVIGPLCARDTTSEFTNRSNGWKVGDTVSFRTHGEYSVDEFSTSINTQDITTSSRAMTIEKHYDVSVEVTARELALDLDSFSDQVIRPSIYKMAETVDTYLGSKLLQAAGLYASDALFADALDMANARKAAILQQLSMNRFCLVDLDTEAALLGKDWFNQHQTRGDDGTRTLRMADMGFAMGMDFFNSIAFPTSAHSCGDATFVTNNGGATANPIGDLVLTVDGGASVAKGLAIGDRIAIAGVRRPLIVKTAILQAACGAATSIELVDPITEVIPDDAAVTVVGSDQDLTFHGAIFDDRSLAVAFPMLDLPEDKVAAVASSNGISIRMVKGYTQTTKVTTLSLDLLVGSFMLDPRHTTLLAEY